MTLRTKKTQTRYDIYRNNNKKAACYLCKAKSLYNFKKWKIVENEYPYDFIASRHHMITLKKHTGEEKLTKAERDEFTEIKRQFLNSNYDMLFENTDKKKSIKNHYHLHMMDYKKSEMTPLTVPRKWYEYLLERLKARAL